MYDKVKGWFMPYDTHKYRGLDYYWRAAGAFSVCTAITTLLVYPFDTIHTRIAADLTPKGKPRLFTTTFDCFNRTHIDEGRIGLYKGYQLAILSSVLRASLTLPIYDTYSRGLPNQGAASGWLNNFNQRLGASFVSSMLISLLLYPLDTMKRCQ